MTEFVAVHGAFRGPWYWEPLAVELGRRGHQLYDRSISAGESLDTWVDRAVERVEQCGTRAGGADRALDGRSGRPGCDRSAR